MTQRHTSAQLELFPESGKKKAPDLSSTFADNMSLPVHRWFRYTAGFSAAWVRDVVRSEKGVNVLDPFGGSGTVPLECEFAGVNAIGIEAHPYVHRIASAKLLWKMDPQLFYESAKKLLDAAKGKEVGKVDFPDLITKCYPLETLQRLDALKQVWSGSDDSDELRLMNWFVITSILRISSPVGTAQWQYVLPNKSKVKVIDPFIAFEAKVFEMRQDMLLMQGRFPEATSSKIHLEDARKMSSVPDGWADLVITSPPYANNYDYADATRLEMSFWGEIDGWADLELKVRRHLVTACTQNVTKLKGQSEEMLESALISPIREEMREVFTKLSEIRLEKGGKKNYHLMVLAYFKDLAQVFYELRRVTRDGCKVCFVVGDSAPYGVYVPVDRWLGELALAAGFNTFEFEKLRDRNNKWKNRKHRVPLQEGRLWIEG